MNWLKTYESFENEDYSDWGIGQEEVKNLFSDLSDSDLIVSIEFKKKLLPSQENILGRGSDIKFTLVPTITAIVRVSYKAGEKFKVVEDIKSVLESTLFNDCIEVAESRLKTKGYEMKKPYREMDMIVISFFRTNI